MLNRLLTLLGVRPAEAGLAESVAWAVDQVEPRLRHVGGFPRRYREAVARALQHSRGLASAMRPPLAVGRSEFQRDPMVRALFPAGDDIPLLIQRSQAVQSWLAEGEGDSFVALMGVRLREKQVLGMALEGDALRRDVARGVAMFSDHTLTALAPNEAGARTLLEREFLASLVDQVRSRVLGLRARRDELERLRSAPRAAAPSPPSAEESQHHEREMQEVSAALDWARYPEHFRSVLLEPALHVDLRPTRVAVDSLGVCSLEPPRPGEAQVDLCELAGRDRRRWMVTLVRCQRAELESVPDFRQRLADAGRWLAI